MQESFFINDTATTEIYTLSLHDALPICEEGSLQIGGGGLELAGGDPGLPGHAVEVGGPAGWRGDLDGAVDPCRWVAGRDRKSTRLNSSHANISHAVFCLKQKHTQHPSSR